MVYARLMQDPVTIKFIRLYRVLKLMTEILSLRSRCGTVNDFSSL